VQKKYDIKSSSLTIDVEEYFQVEAFANNIKMSEWINYPSRIEYQMQLLLELLEETQVKATFFILGYIAEKHPKLIKLIAQKGHEVASHGFNHQHITKQSQQTFSNDITKAKLLLEDIISAPIKGYRAPCFSITAANSWAHDEIANSGYLYSSSTYPIAHDFYGVPDAPRTPYYLNNGLLEIPVSTVKFQNKILPAGGGGYFRLLPYFIFKRMLNSSEKQLNFINFYTHPWEYDPEQPKIESNAKSNFRHRVNQGSALGKLRKLCNAHQFSTLADVHLVKDYPNLGKWADIASGDFQR
jgi:polysaccharide deacetylase family protein (PEP-CTERM system associated)